MLQANDGQEILRRLEKLESGLYSIQNNILIAKEKSLAEQDKFWRLKLKDIRRMLDLNLDKGKIKYSKLLFCTKGLENRNLYLQCVTVADFAYCILYFFTVIIVGTEDEGDLFFDAAETENELETLLGNCQEDPRLFNIKTDLIEIHKNLAVVRNQQVSLTTNFYIMVYGSLSILEEAGS